MAVKGDPDKKPEDCKPPYTRCKNMKETNLTDMSGETYECEVCGERFYLDYDDMR